jgi:anti-sigma B factor antagonist
MLPRIHPASRTRSTTTAIPTNSRGSLTTLRQDRTTALVRAVGEWDLANAHLLAEQLEEHETAGRRFVRLDVSAVSFLDCTCLEVLVAAHRRLLAARGTLVLTGVTPRLTRLIGLARLDEVLLTTDVSDLDARPDQSRRLSLVRPARRPA